MSESSPFQPVLPDDCKEACHWGRIHGSALGLILSNAARQHDGLIVAVTADMRKAEELANELKFYMGEAAAHALLTLPDRETLPYDVFSPHQDIISERLYTLHRLPAQKQGILIVPVDTLIVRLPPREYLEANSLIINKGDRLQLGAFRERLDRSGYRCVSQVMEHGEYSVRGSLIDLFPMGSAHPFRIDLFDDEVDSIRVFQPEDQRSTAQIDHIRLLPANEFPLDEEAITRFRQGWRSRFSGDPQNSPAYREVSKQAAPPGIEYYLPLFFEHTQTLFDYLPRHSVVLFDHQTRAVCDERWEQITERYEQGRHDKERPLLAPEEVFLPPDETMALVQALPHCSIQPFKLEERPGNYNFGTHAIPILSSPQPGGGQVNALRQFIKNHEGRVLLVAETTGRREMLLEMLHDADFYPAAFACWRDFLESDAGLGITVSLLDQGLLIDEPPIAVISESQLYGEQAMQRRRRKVKTRDSDAIIRNLTELNHGAPVVHEEHGVGRYLGLQSLDIGGLTTEYLTLEYAGGDKLYVPVSSLHLISRYTGAAPEQAPLHKLGSQQWQKARRRAARKARDVAAELLDIYARRQARQGRVFPAPDDQYAAFAASFPFEETPDQLDAINAVIADMTAERPMDRLVCGDVGFGKTEVAVRAAFMAIQGNTQVAVLVPTTLLAQQHFQNFRDRFSELPVRIEVLSRFRTAKEQQSILADTRDGKVDILIGTHKLLQKDVAFKNLGLVIIDEEHRFGVKQKERFKELRAEVDVLTLTATPIPRTLNMALSDLRSLSIIATPPLQRLAVKTFVREWDNALLKEACLREIRRGGQIYFLHNEVRTIDKIRKQLGELMPEARIRVAHGQMPEKELEQIMLDFYHQRFSILLCTTIIESGIDVPNANTIIINRADKLGLAQLYQLRGRVGRSHHQAYAYLIIPPRGVITADALKRLEAIESIEDLGAGFTLATHDLEIRGAGELLGEDQSGQIQEIGFTMYTEMLERAVADLKSGREPALDQALHPQTEVDLHIPALIPEDYLPDVHSRLVLYKRIANAANENELDELQVEMIDRFGLLPEAVKNLFMVTELKLRAQALGILKIDAGPAGGRLVFDEEPEIDPAALIRLIQEQPRRYKFDGKNKLRFQLDGEDVNDRIAAVGKLLDTLASK